MLDEFSVADAYLVTVLNWTQVIPEIEMARHPAIAAYLDRMRKRPSVAKAMAEEVPMYRAEMARHRAA